MHTLPTKLLSANDCRRLEQSAMQYLCISSYELMQRAGLASFQSLCEFWPECRSIVILCGSGNNGGDGYIVAALAADRKWDVTVISVGSPKSQDAQTARQYASDKKVRFAEMQDIEWSKVDVVVDSLLGIGAQGAVWGCTAEIIQWINRLNCPVLSIDVPSGLNADSGSALGAVVRATHTCTFVGLKLGLMTSSGPDYTGTLSFHNLGIPEHLMSSYGEICSLITEDKVARLLPRRRVCAHKGMQGHVVLVGGNRGMAGALRLSSETAARTGAGLVSAITISEHVGIVNVSQPEIMVHCNDDPRDEKITALIQSASSLGIGPGLGTTDWATELWRKVLSASAPKVIDADALNLLASDNLRFHSAVITPHPGEAARLLKCDTATINSDRILAVLKLARKYSTVCVLKGAGTLVSDGTQIWLNSTGNSGMASGGMGDCLTGVIAGLMAQGVAPIDAAICGVWLHGTAADMESKHSGTIGMLASDLIPHIRTLLNRLPNEHKT